MLYCHEICIPHNRVFKILICVGEGVVVLTYTNITMLKGY